MRLQNCIHTIVWKFGAELNLVDWRLGKQTKKLNFTKFLSNNAQGPNPKRDVTPSHLPPFLFYTVVQSNPPNVIPAKFPGHTVYTEKSSSIGMLHSL